MTDKEKEKDPTLNPVIPVQEPNAEQGELFIRYIREDSGSHLVDTTTGGFGLELLPDELYPVGGKDLNLTNEFAKKLVEDRVCEYVVQKKPVEVPAKSGEQLQPPPESEPEPESEAESEVEHDSNVESNSSSLSQPVSSNSNSDSAAIVTS